MKEQKIEELLARAHALPDSPDRTEIIRQLGIEKISRIVTRVEQLEEEIFAIENPPPLETISEVPEAIAPETIDDVLTEQPQ